MKFQNKGALLVQIAPLFISQPHLLVNPAIKISLFLVEALAIGCTATRCNTLQHAATHCNTPSRLKQDIWIVGESTRNRMRQHH